MAASRADTVVAPSRQPLQNMRVVPIGGSLSLSFVPTTPGNWVFHCHFAGHVGEIVSLHGSPDAHVVPSADGDQAMPAHDAPGGHTMRGLVDRHARHAGARLQGARRREPAHDQSPDSEAAERARRWTDRVRIPAAEGRDGPGARFDSDPGPVLELKRGEPVRIAGQEQPRRAERRALARAGDRELSGRRAGIQRYRRPHHAADSAGRVVRRGVHAAAQRHVPVSLAPARDAADRLRDVRRDHRERCPARHDARSSDRRRRRRAAGVLQAGAELPARERESTTRARFA